MKRKKTPWRSLKRLNSKGASIPSPLEYANPETMGSPRGHLKGEEMKIKLIEPTTEYLVEADFQNEYTVVTDKNKLTFMDGEPEDNNLSRNFNSVYSIIDLIEEAYEAGVKGDKLVIERRWRDDDGEYDKDKDT